MNKKYKQLKEWQDINNRIRKSFQKLLEPMNPRTLEPFSKGFTLIEMVIVIVILSIVSAITIKFLVDSLTIYTMTVNQKTLLDEGKLALERMCRDIRDAQSILVPNTGSSGTSITFTRTNATGHTDDESDPALDHANEDITFQWDGTSGHPLQKVKQYPTNPTTVPLAENVTAFTVTRGAPVTNNLNEITLVVTLSLPSGENVTLQTKVYPKNFPTDTTYKNFKNYWEEEESI